MNLADETAKRRDDFNRVSTQMLFTDLELGHTFATIAASQKDHKTEALAKARRTYDEISRLRWIVNMDQNDAIKLDDGLLHLRDRLSELGESFR
jgi:hypothetical protein